MEKVPKEFSEEEDQMLRELWDRYGDTNGESIFTFLIRKYQGF